MATRRRAATPKPIDFHDKLLKALSEVDRPGDFCTSGDRPLVMPGLEVDRMGVVGLPLTADGRESAMAGKVRDFAARLQAKLAVDVILWDERFSSQEADRWLAGRKRKRREDRDLVAAELIRAKKLAGRVGEKGGFEIRDQRGGAGAVGQRQVEPGEGFLHVRGGSHFAVLEEHHPVGTDIGDIQKEPGVSIRGVRALGECQSETTGCPGLINGIEE